MCNTDVVIDNIIFDLQCHYAFIVYTYEHLHFLMHHLFLLHSPGNHHLKFCESRGLPILKLYLQNHICVCPLKLCHLSILPRPVALTPSGNFFNTLNLLFSRTTETESRTRTQVIFMHISLRNTAPKCIILFSLGCFICFLTFPLFFELYKNDIPLVSFCHCFIHRVFLRFIPVSLCSHSWLYDITFTLIFFLDKHLSVLDMSVPVCLHVKIFSMLCTQE